MAAQRPRSGVSGRTCFTEQEKQLFSCYGVPPEMTAERSAALKMAMKHPQGGVSSLQKSKAVRPTSSDATSWRQQAIELMPHGTSTTSRQASTAFDHEAKPRLKTSPDLRCRSDADEGTGMWASKVQGAHHTEAESGRTSSKAASAACATPKSASSPGRRRGGTLPSPNRRVHSAARDKARNPFIEYEDREKRLMRERRWLQEDSDYLEAKKEDLRHGTLLNHLSLQVDSQQDLYEKRIFYGPYSVKLKASQANRSFRGASGLQTSNSSPSLNSNRKNKPDRAISPSDCREDRSAAQSMRWLAQELKNSCGPQTRQRFQGLELEGLEILDFPLRDDVRDISKSKAERIKEDLKPLFRRLTEKGKRATIISRSASRVSMGSKSPTKSRKSVLQFP